MIATSLITSLIGCGAGFSSQSEDTESGSASTAPTTDSAEVDISLSGANKYRYGDEVVLSYSLSGNSVSGATVTFQGPPELTLDTEASTLSGSGMVPGDYDLTVTATTTSFMAEASVILQIDANFGGRYVSNSGDSVELVIGHGNDSQVDELGFVTERRDKAYWYREDTDGAGFINELCFAEITFNGSEGSGTGTCKVLVDGAVNVQQADSVSFGFADDGSLGLSYALAGALDAEMLSFSSSPGAYISPSLDLSGVYTSTLLQGELDYLIVSSDTVASESYDLETARCTLSATIVPYEATILTATQADGSVIAIDSATLENCDLSDQAGYVTAVGEASGADQAGLLLILTGGVSDSVLRFDMFLTNVTGMEDPISKLRYVRVCYEGSTTSSSDLYDVTQEDCEILSAG
jgi:hypothetical protein